MVAEHAKDPRSDYTNLIDYLVYGTSLVEVLLVSSQPKLFFLRRSAVGQLRSELAA
jgi:hypothetical protein